MNVVLGAGPLGLAVARSLAARGQAVRLVNRHGRAAPLAGIPIVAGDASVPGGLRSAVARARVIYHCAKPPYTQWPALFPALMRGVIAAAADTGARVVYADNLYMYGPVEGRLTEKLPLRPVGAKGRVRAEMAEQLLTAHAKGEVAATIGRASDFYGPHAREAILGERVVPAAIRGGTAELLGNLDQPHTHIFIDDFARGLVTLGERDEALGQIWHIPSAPTVSTRSLVEMIFETAGNPVRIRTAPRFLVTLMALFNPTMRELKETLYQVERPFVVDHTKFAQTFGGETTSHRDAVRQTVEWYRTALATKGTTS
jgi:nucleoside-diphosphate-sugar epimerase